MDNRLTDEENDKEKDSPQISFWGNIAQNHVAIFAVLFLLINIVIVLLKLWPSGIVNMVVRMNLSTATNIAAGLLFLFFAYKTDTVKDIGLFTTKGILKGLLLGLPTVSIWIYYALGYASIWHFRKVPKVSDVLFALLFLLSVGFNEELSMRGVLLPVLLRHRKDEKSGVVMAVFWSSVLFGVLHYFQWHENSLQTALHVLHTTLMGMFLATVFLLTRNIWSAIIVHALYDLVEFLRYFVFYFQSSMSPTREFNRILGTSLPENANTDWILSFIFILPIFAVTVIYLAIILKGQINWNER